MDGSVREIGIGESLETLAFKKLFIYLLQKERVSLHSLAVQELTM